MNGFSDSLRMEVSRKGVSITVICPYWVVTEFQERYLDKDGNPKGKSGRVLYNEKMMTADNCARITLEAARLRKRMVVMRPGMICRWLNLIIPKILDQIILSVNRKAIKKYKN